MGRFSDRLSRLKPGVSSPSSATEPVEPPLSTPEPTVEFDGSLETLRPWWMVDTPQGRAHVYRETTRCERVLPPTDLADRLGDPRLDGFRPDNALYLDIEATGLSHGAGTFAFLIGCAYFEGTGPQRTLVLEQLFMSDPENEMPVLAHFLDLIYRFDYLVSFNGKSYDLSVLQNRLIMTRLMSAREGELKLRPHLDLLHSCRVAYVGAFENTKLQTLEREVLRLHPDERKDDVPGSLVPSLYFHYLRTGFAPVLDVVLKHNRTDVLSMVGLTEHLMDLVERPPESLAPVVAYNLGRAAVRFKQAKRGVAYLVPAVESCQLPPTLHDKALTQLITAARRAEQFELAAEHTDARAAAIRACDPFESARLAGLAAKYRRKASRQSAQ